MADFHIRSDCRLCSGPIREVLRLPDTPLANELPKRIVLDGIETDRFEAAGRYFTRETGQDHFPLFLSQCEQCGHVQLPVVVDPKRLFPVDYPYQSGTSPVFMAHLAELAHVIEGLRQGATRLLDIGSNDGSFMACFRGSSWSVTGVDPAAPEGVGYRALFGHGWARKHRRETGRMYGVITALNVFAHCDDLSDFIAGVAELLAPDGVFVFEVGYFKDVCERGLVGTLYHEHASYHTIRPLDAFFARHGLCLNDAHRVDSQGGSIRCFVRRRENMMASSIAWHRIMSLAEAEKDLDVSRLRHTVDRRRDIVTDRIRWARKGGKSVAAFGAPAKLTTWSYALGLRPDDITCVYDDNPLKVGRCTPGNFWPIVPSSRLLEDNPDAVVLFSSNFEAEIRERFRDYRGEWIVV